MSLTVVKTPKRIKMYFSLYMLYKGMYLLYAGHTANTILVV